jgi:hypothetical protein
LAQALERSSKVAVAKFVCSERERLGLLRVRDDVIVLCGVRQWPRCCRLIRQAGIPEQLWVDLHDSGLLDERAPVGLRGRRRERHHPLCIGHPGRLGRTGLAPGRIHLLMPAVDG